jgi:fructose-1,6-bisphosphatase I
VSEPLGDALRRMLAARDDGDRLASVVGAIAEAACTIGAALARVPAQPGLLARSGGRNVHGEAVLAADELAQRVLVDALRASGAVFWAASEEAEEPIPLPLSGATGYAVTLDPLDGSSGVTANAPAGVIFGVYGPDAPGGWRIPAGREQAAAGYVLFGPATLLVLTAGDGTHVFARDPDSGEFVLAQSGVRCPEEGAVYSVSEGNRGYWDERFREVVDGYKELDGGAGKPYKLRHAGALVADFHHVLVKGGIFAYPPTTRYPRGKLRLVYELAPLAFVCEQAGGAALDGGERILDLVPEDVHARAPIYIGSRALVEEAVASVRTTATAPAGSAGRN